MVHLCFTEYHNTACDYKVRNGKWRKEKKSVTCQDPLKVGSLNTESVQGSNPCLFVGTLNFGFVSEALAGLCSDVFVAKFFPLVAVVDTGTAQQTRQIVLDLGVVLNQLCYRIKLCLAFLPPQKQKQKQEISKQEVIRKS